jgi:hypothetical protein
MSPLCESYLTAEQLNRMEPFYPLHVKVSEECYLVQLGSQVPGFAVKQAVIESSRVFFWSKHQKKEF